MQSIKRTYEQIVKRLREERIGFDHQLTALERTFAAKQRDYEELLLLSGDANHAREVAQSELSHVRNGYEEERRRRDLELRERHQMVQLRKQTLGTFQRHESARQQNIYDEHVPNDGQGPVAVVKSTTLQRSKERTEQRTKIDIFERAFRKIKEATGNSCWVIGYKSQVYNLGVSDVNEVIQKIIVQESTTENLMSLTRDNQQKIEALSEQKVGIKMHVEEVKYSGPGGGHRRKLVDKHEAQLASAAARLERCRIKHERLTRMVIAVKAGVKHLQDKLDGVREELGGRHIQLTDATTFRVMAENEIIMAELMARIRVATDNESNITNGAARSTDVHEIDLLRARPYNQRIDLPLLDEEWDRDGLLKDNDDFKGEVDDELTREKVKKASSQILIAQDKRKQKMHDQDASN